MANFVDLVGLRRLFEELGIDPASGNLEETYDVLVLAMDLARKGDRVSG